MIILDRLTLFISNVACILGCGEQSRCRGGAVHPDLNQPSVSVRVIVDFFRRLGKSLVNLDDLTADRGEYLTYRLDRLHRPERIVRLESVTDLR